MTLADFKGVAHGALEPVVEVCERHGMQPNQITAISLGLSALAAYLFYLATPVAYIGAAVVVVVSGLLDVVDGELARKTGESTPAGDFLDHAFDRFSDVIIVVGVTAGVNQWMLGTFALTGVILTSYLGTQAQAVGAGRDYGGLMGRSDRFAIVILGAVVQAFVPVLTQSFQVGGATVPELSPVSWVLIVYAVLGNLTALQRFFTTWNNLGE
ncbi:MAG: CDP-alcohol phosphatidyltransferase family protein [Halobacteria archaeon]